MTDGLEYQLQIDVSLDRDTDGDGVIDQLDLDSDNDGISDLYESGNLNARSLDANNDGTLGAGESIDTDDDGIKDIFEGTNLLNNTGTTPVDSDSDGIDDYLDLDSDNDSIADTIEARPTAGYDSHADDGSDNVDSDGDGVLDMFDSNNTFGATHANFNAPVNTDGTDEADYLDADSDNDGFLDSAESGLAVTDATYANPDGSVGNLLTDLNNDDNDASEADFRSLGDFTDDDESFNVDEDVSLNNSVLNGSSSVEGPITVTGFTVGGNNFNPGETATFAGIGTLRINSDGSFVFTPVANYHGSVPTATYSCLLYTSPSPRDRQKSRMPSSA